MPPPSWRQPTLEGTWGVSQRQPSRPVPRRDDRTVSAARRRLSPCLLAAATAMALMTLAFGSGCTSTATKRHVYHYNDPVPPADLAFRRSLDSFGNVMVKGNRAELLENGDQIFPAMIKAIAGARRTVDLESYIFSDDRAGAMITNALVDAARRGVEVRVLVDGTGGHPGA